MEGGPAAGIRLRPDTTAVALHDGAADGQADAHSLANVSRRSTAAAAEASVVGPTAQDISSGQFEALIRAMRAGVTYANVHSTKFPNGEMRGQIKVED